MTEFHWDENSYDSEADLTTDIRRRLLTEDQRQKLFEWDISIEDLLNGRVKNDPSGSKYAYFFDAWNSQIGRKVFGF